MWQCACLTGWLQLSQAHFSGTWDVQTYESEPSLCLMQAPAACGTMQRVSQVIKMHHFNFNFLDKAVPCPTASKPLPKSSRPVPVEPEAELPALDLEAAERSEQHMLSREAVSVALAAEAQGGCSTEALEAEVLLLIEYIIVISV